MPTGADPHNYQASARQANQMREADALIVNGAGFEEGLSDVIDAATDDGTATFAAISAVDTIESGGDRDDDVHPHDDEEPVSDEVDASEHATEGGEDRVADEHGEHEHQHENADPHFFTDPVRMATSVTGMTDFLIGNLDGIDPDALRAAADAYVAELEHLDSDVEAVLAAVPDERRILVTNHEVFGYFADRYGFRVVGTVIPSGSTAEGASAGALADLAEVIDHEGVPAIFARAG
jgi:zinc/manganese transport system substrate-binding protein